MSTRFTSRSKEIVPEVELNTFEKRYSDRRGTSVKDFLYAFIACLCTLGISRLDAEHHKTMSHDEKREKYMSWETRIALIGIIICISTLAATLITQIILFQYWTTITRPSKLGYRLNELSFVLIEETRKIVAMTDKKSMGDARDLHFWSDEDNIAQLEDLLEAPDFRQLRYHVSLLRDATRRLSIGTADVDRSWNRSIFVFLETCGQHLWRFFSLKSSNAAAQPREIVHDAVIVELREAAKRVMICPLPTIKYIRAWEQTLETTDLVDKAEIAVQSIQTLISNVPEFKLLPGFDFDKIAAVAYWELPVSPTTAGAAYAVPEILWDDSDWVMEPFGLPEESVLGRYPRKEVPKSVLSPKGHFRGICKLRMTQETTTGQRRAHGTGWLIDASTVVTAAHNLCRSKGAGYVSEVVVQLGVYGQLADPILEEQQAHSVAVNWGYHVTGRKKYDFAIIRLRAPFKDIVPIAFSRPALMNNHAHLTVVGYPGDLFGKGDSRKGFRMFASDASVSYNITRDGFMINHPLDTYPGNSGGPILETDIHGTYTAIGVHCYGTTDPNKTNSGPPLGYNGNDIHAFVKAMNDAEGGGGTSVSSSNIPNLKRVEVPIVAP